MQSFKSFLVAVALSTVAACANEQPKTLAPDFGNAVRHNMGLQVVDPEPSYATDGAPTFHGQKASDAYKRYREGKVKEPTALSTTTGAVTTSAGGTN